ncbi:MAG: chromosome segregation protein SMC [Alphaproteobacteria bacterium]|nr:chromosome segregation protein SMC [Alphaproteobacteria bacterium]
MQFLKLKLTGFKSFVDSTELPIEAGLTGIVGPNGCGKSNLVEALRWSMGETSAKQMRGGEMDDVIFSGTSDRPARNLAEVVLQLDNRDRTAPALFNDQDDLEVSRQIERNEGSRYRVNGRDVRAKDVQLLFADATTGSRSTALVSQGRIGAIINAKPEERRGLLEAAAGIAGLHSRRHEAELRLRAAETNLGRVDDVIETLETQLKGLKRQSRQASRYRRLSERIREVEALLLHLKWIAACTAVENAEQRLHHGESDVSERTQHSAAAAAAQAEVAATLPDLRKAEAEAAAELQRLLLARDGLDAEEARIQSAQRECAERIAQIESDLVREQALTRDAAEAIGRLEEERKNLIASREGEAEAQAEATERLTAASAEVDTLETELTRLTERVAADEARKAKLTEEIRDLEARRTRLNEHASEINERRSRLQSEGVEPATREEIERATATAMAAAAEARETAERMEQNRQLANDKASEARSALHEAEAVLTRLRAEEAALAELLENAETGNWAPLADSVSVSPGYEAALGVALGDDLNAATDAEAPIHWRAGPRTDAAALPEGATPLGDYVKAPEVLRLRLSQIGVVPDAATGARLAASLRQGQRLVSKAGDLWRWDGFAIRAGTATAAATRLKQRNRMEVLRAELGRAESALTERAEADERARDAAEKAAQAERASRQALTEAETALAQAREAQTALARKSAETDSQLHALEEGGERLGHDREETETRLRAATEAFGQLGNLEAARNLVEEKRQALSKRRIVMFECQATHDRLRQEGAARTSRLHAIEAEAISWQKQAEGAERQQGLLKERRQAADTEQQRLSTLPEEIAAKRGELVTRIEASEKVRQAAADRLAEGESRLSETDKALKAAEAELAEGRENRIRLEAEVTQAVQAREVLIERIHERLECTPEETAEVAGLKEGVAPPDQEEIEVKLDRYMRERERMGPVNLRAEAEAEELQERIDSMTADREDLVAAIARLRKGIAELNREGEERLMAAFTQVDTHFRELFVRLFGGGKAHLKLTESEDPLEAGLEIMASPPGKRLQVMSLLSGGEQALTAIALLFAVFLTNPAPICVLDEVDAPLDDANVDRFCTLVEQLAHNSKTRFLVITHHRMTMARMDRLFGVTMGERGVSQLVSVDLQGAERMRATA